MHQMRGIEDEDGTSIDVGERKWRSGVEKLEFGAAFWSYLICLLLC